MGHEGYLLYFIHRIFLKGDINIVSFIVTKVSLNKQFIKVGCINNTIFVYQMNIK